MRYSVDGRRGPVLRGARAKREIGFADVPSLLSRLGKIHILDDMMRHPFDVKKL